MNIQSTRLPRVMVVETTPKMDHRGAFTRLFCKHELSAVIGERKIDQINYSRTAIIGAVRGLHFQYPPHAEMKLVRCLRGRVLDIAVDLRAGSPTFLQWHAQELSSENASMLVIPEGCAHGFQVLEAESELLYLHTTPYEPKAEGGFCFNDPRIDISWPLPVTNISEGDLSLPAVDQDFGGISL